MKKSTLNKFIEKYSLVQLVKLTISQLYIHMKNEYLECFIEEWDLVQKVKFTFL